MGRIRIRNKSFRILNNRLEGVVFNGDVNVYRYIPIDCSWRLLVVIDGLLQSQVIRNVVCGGDVAKSFKTLFAAFLVGEYG